MQDLSEKVFSVQIAVVLPQSQWLPFLQFVNLSGRVMKHAIFFSSFSLLRLRVWNWIPFFICLIDRQFLLMK
jgi:hypothetical protein